MGTENRLYLQRNIRYGSNSRKAYFDQINQRKSATYIILFLHSILVDTTVYAIAYSNSFVGNFSAKQTLTLK